MSKRIVNYIKYTRECNSAGYFPEDYADWSDIALKFKPIIQKQLLLKNFMNSNYKIIMSKILLHLF